MIPERRVYLRGHAALCPPYSVTEKRSKIMRGVGKAQRAHVSPLIVPTDSYSPNEPSLATPAQSGLNISRDTHW